MYLKYQRHRQGLPPLSGPASTSCAVSDNMDLYKGRVALVTGASSGIGAAIAAALVNHGMIVVGVGRDMDRLKAVTQTTTSPENYHPYQCDLSKEDEIEKLFKSIRDNHGGVDVLINNAGLSKPGSILNADSKAEDWRYMFEVNVMALAKCCQEAYKCMKSRNVDDGYIINISSVLGHAIIPGAPDLSMYSASKFAVSAICQALRYELRQAESNIRITDISPGAVETEFLSNMFGKPVTYKDMFNAQMLSAEDVSATVLHALSSPPHVQVDQLIFRSKYQGSP